MQHSVSQDFYVCFIKDAPWWLDAMPGRRVWAVSGRGNVYTLSVKNSHWEQVNNQGAKCLQGFKKISTVSTCVWGLGCDHQVYVYVTSDLPIRSQQATYENERWIPSRGWSGQNLLPVDPWVWSSDDCLRCLPKEDFKVPSEHWEWESDWYVDENVHGHLTDKGVMSSFLTVRPDIIDF